MNAINSLTDKANSAVKEKNNIPAYYSTRELLHKQIDDFESDDSHLQSYCQSGQEVRSSQKGP